MIFDEEVFVLTVPKSISVDDSANWLVGTSIALPVSSIRCGELGALCSIRRNAVLSPNVAGENATANWIFSPGAMDAEAAVLTVNSKASFPSILNE